MKKMMTTHTQVTHRDELSIQKYLNEIRKEDLLSPEKEVELARRIKEGDEEAFEEMIRANLRFVVSVAKEYQNRGLSFSDLINEGNLGLIKAVKRFDETKGFKFISYAVWWIRQSILVALAEKGRMIRLPLNKVNAIKHINKTYSELETKHEREPALQEVVENLEISYHEINKAWEHTNKPLSMDAPINEEEEDNMYDVVESDENPPPNQNLINESLKRDIEKMFSLLTETESTIIRMYYGIGDNHPYTLDGISVKINLTRERIRQIKGKAIRKLRNNNNYKILKSYME